MALRDLIVRGPMPKPKKPESIHPIDIDKTSWMYPLSEGLTVVHEIRIKDHYVRTDTIKIKWVDVGIAMERRKMLRKPYPKNVKRPRAKAAT